MAPAPRVTTDEYLRGPETVLPQELIYGVLRVADAPTPRHQSLVLDLAIALSTYVKDQKAGRIWISPIDVILDRERALVVQPDLIFVSNARLPMVTDRVWGAPDLVLEVLSPKPRIGRLEERLDWFAAYGVRECWLAHQLEEHLDVLTFANGRIARRASFDPDSTIHSGALPGFRCSLRSVLTP